MKKSNLISKGLLLLGFGFLVVGLASCGSGGGTDPTGTTGSDATGTGTTQTTGGGGGGGDSSGATATYNISFYTGEGATQIEKMTGIKEGDSITAPQTPKLAYHQFEGWYTDYGKYEKEFTFNKMPGYNVCLYAKWSKSMDDSKLEAYEHDLLQTSQEGHLYIHYLRFNNVPEDYEPLNLWVWPYQYTGREFDWKRDSAGNIIVDDVAGATADIDLTIKYTDAGKEKNQNLQFLSSAGKYQAGDINDATKYMNPQLGFLIVYKDSKNSGTHWRSDGNADQLFEISAAKWTNGSLHVFAIQDNVPSYTHHVSDEEIVNPYAGDDGNSVSISNVNSSEVLKVKHGTQLTQTVSGVGYQIMVSSFADSNGDGIGDIRGIINHMDYLEDLNVDVLWLTPIQLSDSYHGYDIIDYKAVDPKFGTLADYQELLTLAHEKGMKVIMDLVLNHTSTNNVWFKESAKLNPEYRNFYQWRNHEKETNLSADWYPYSEYAYSYYGKFSPSMPELNYDYQGTRDAIVDVAKYWLNILGNKTGVDGFRIDAVKHIYMADESTADPNDIIISDFDTATNTDYSSNLTKNINFFTYLSNEIKDEYPNAYLVGENFDGHAFNVAPYYTAFDGMLDFYMYYQFGEIAKYPTSAASKAGASGSSEGSLPKGTNTNRLQSGIWNYPGALTAEAYYSSNGLESGKGSGVADVVDSMFTSNHDIQRLMNNMVGGTVTQSNAAFGERMAKATIATQMMLPGVTYIYYGDEIGMSSNFNTGETSLSPHVDRQYRQPFKWTTKDYNETGGSADITHYSISGDETYYVTWDSYNKTVAGADEQAANPNSFLNYVRYWTDIKSKDEVIRFGTYGYKAISWNPGTLFTFTRTYNGHTYWVVTNFDQYDYTNLDIFNGTTLKYVTPGGSLNVIPAGGTIVVEI